MKDQLAEDPAEQGLTAPEKVWELICAFGVAATMIPLFMNLVSGRPFFPSYAFYEATLNVGRGFAFVGLLLGVYCYWVIDPLERRRKGTPLSDSQLAIAKILLPFVVAGSFYWLPLTAYPMAKAIIAGRLLSDTYVVEDLPAFGDRKCRGRVSLKNMPFFHDRICDVPDFVRDRLRPGKQIEFEGWGTEDGLFVKSVRLPEGT